jgi:hypothetical protein
MQAGEAQYTCEGEEHLAGFLLDNEAPFGNGWDDLALYEARAQQISELLKQLSNG